MEFEIKKVKYRAAKLGVFEQLKVSRKLLPVMAGMVSEFRSLQEKIKSKDTEAVLSSILPKIADAVSGMSDEDVNAILFPCLSVVTREHMKSWVPVCQHDQMAFDDIDMFAMLNMVARVVADSLGNFLRELPTPETPTQPAA
ncbi:MULTISPECIES: phage tail assembly chaperone [Enterobacteriaceae]|jgi:hypothetical protein|uniref:phage tail assembly chaperone n=1 Tax=Enterobacteriaceae TaxID=543 RepID=UPI00190145E7|nr:hypothetical protein [Citrobacter europaeus]MBJ8823606.1 hypothetical protein [Citrobacter freundii]MDT7086230.1 hypothetical protein [Citrobacter europaeus]